MGVASATGNRRDRLDAEVDLIEEFGDEWLRRTFLPLMYGGTWTGSGIVTSQTQATTSNFTSLGVATASQAKGIAATATALWLGRENAIIAEPATTRPT